MIQVLTDIDHTYKNQIEFLLGKEIPLTAAEVNSLAHLTVGNYWVIKVLNELGMTIDDIIYECDREILKMELIKNNRVI